MEQTFQERTDCGPLDVTAAPAAQHRASPGTPISVVSHRALRTARKIRVVFDALAARLASL